MLRPHEADIDIGSDDVKGGSFKVDVPVGACTDSDSEVVQCPPGDVRSGLKVGLERQGKGKPWLILRYYCTARLQDQMTTTEGSVGRSCGLTAA